MIRSIRRACLGHFGREPTSLELFVKLPFKLTRRQLILGGLSSLAVGVGTVGYTCFIEPHWVEFVRRDLPIVGLPAALAGKTLVQISDIHVGPQVSDDYLLRCFETVSALEPDFVVLTGDFMTAKKEEQLTHVTRVLEHVPHGRFATLGVLGNHDYGYNWQISDVGDSLTWKLDALGVRILRNECFSVQGLTFIGLDDLWSPNFNLVVAMQGRLTGPSLALCHNPDGADRPGWEDFAGWILSGHTHGGQCKPPFLRPPVCPVANKRYIAGEYDVGEGRRLYINRGLGHIIQARFNARPEITLFRLTAES